MTGQCCDNCANYRDCLTQFMYNGGLLGTECAAWTEKETDRGRFERENYYQPSAVPGKDCLSCGASLSEPGEAYDILHCAKIPCCNDTVEDDFVCGLWNRGGLCQVLK